MDRTKGLGGTDRTAACARLLDIDSDGDLDLLSFAAADNGASQVTAAVLNNNRDGTFTDIAAKLGLALPGQPARTVVQDDFDWIDDRPIQFPQADCALAPPLHSPLRASS